MASIKIVHISGSRKGKTDAFDLKQVRLGRQIDNEICFDPLLDSSVSSHHCEISLNADACWVITDLGSSNGTYVDEMKITDQTPVQAGSSIRLGREGPELTIEALDPVSNLEGAKTEIGMAAVSVVGVGHQLKSSEPVPQADKESMLIRAGDLRAASNNTLDDSGEEKKKPVGANTVALMIQKKSKPMTGILIGLAVLLLVAGGLASYLLSRGSEATEEELAKQTSDTETAVNESTKELAEKGDQIAKTTEEERDRIEGETETAHQELMKEFEDLLEAEGDNIREDFEAKLSTTSQGLADEFETDIADLKTETEALMAEELALHQEQMMSELHDVAEELGNLYSEGIYMVLADIDVLGGEVPICTAFAVKDTGLLATTAKCLTFIETTAAAETEAVMRQWGLEGYRSTLKFYVKMNGFPDKRYAIEGYQMHQDFDGSPFSPDVGLLQIDVSGMKSGKLPVVVQFAEQETVHALEMGQSVYIIGFSDRNMDAGKVVADFRGGHVARLTSYQQFAEPDVENNPMVWHTAMTSEGTYGSPMFNRKGALIGINNSSTSSVKVQAIDVEGVPGEHVIYSADGFASGIRVDVLKELIDSYGSNVKKPPEDVSL